MANKKVSAQIIDILDDWELEATDTIETCTKGAAAMCVKELKELSPKRTGEYAKSWGTKWDKKARMSIVWNRKHYRLTHLLEYGHVTNNWQGRVPAHPHIAIAYENAATQYERDLYRRLK